MTKTLVVFLLCICISCHSPTRQTGRLFDNQYEIENKIQSVQPSSKIEFTIQTTEKRDSILILRIHVNPSMPDSSLSAQKASRVLASFINLVPNALAFKACQIIFVKGSASDGDAKKTPEFGYITRLQQVITTIPCTDSSKFSIGYIDPEWTYHNNEFMIHLKLKKNWFYMSFENTGVEYYTIGGDVNQLPQYQTEDRKISMRTFSSLPPGEPYTLMVISKKSLPLPSAKTKSYSETGPSFSIGLVKAMFASEDEYFKNLYELITSKKLNPADITYLKLGNARFRMIKTSVTLPDKSVFHSITALKDMGCLRMSVNLVYSTDEELEDIKSQLSDLQMNLN